MYISKTRKEFLYYIYTYIFIFLFFGNIEKINYYFIQVTLFILFLKKLFVVNILIYFDINHRIILFNYEEYFKNTIYIFFLIFIICIKIIFKIN